MYICKSSNFHELGFFIFVFFNSFSGLGSYECQTLSYKNSHVPK